MARISAAHRSAWLRRGSAAFAFLGATTGLGSTARALTPDSGTPFPADPAWLALTQGGVALGDPTADITPSQLDIIGSATAPAVYVAQDAANFYIRMRLNHSPLNPQGTDVQGGGWGCEIDTDGNLTNSYEYLAIVDASGSKGVTRFEYNSIPNSNGPTDTAEVAIQNYTQSNWRLTAIPGSNTSGDLDYFLDMSFSLADLAAGAALVTPTAPPILTDLAKPLTFFCGSSANGTALTKDLGSIGTYSGNVALSTIASDPVTCTAAGCVTAGSCTADAASCTNSARPKCDLATGACVQCLIAADCAAGFSCSSAHACVCVSDAGTCDSDGDGLSDNQEIALGSNPNDADSDDDGVPDGMEPSPGIDTDGDGLINVLDPDSDNDGLRDGTEMGLGCSGPGTAPGSANCLADADPTTTTDPLNADTDGGGVTDGSEDANLNGKVDAGETNPVAGQGADDATAANKDTDGDGLSDALETFLGTDPNVADTDKDGVPDGLEPNPSLDTDGDGLINARDPDSDGDGLFDGTEMGRDCSSAPGSATCIADADPTTKTSPLLADTDRGGVMDGVEDANHNGKLDAGETDPTLGHGADDGTLIADAGPDSSAGGSGTGGSGTGGSGTGGAGGSGTGGSGTGAVASTGGTGASGRVIEGAGCNCTMAGDRGPTGGLAALGALGLALGLTRRRRRR